MFRHAVGAQDVVQNHNPEQLTHVRAANDRKNVQPAGSHPFQRDAQAVIGMNVRKRFGEESPSKPSSCRISATFLFEAPSAAACSIALVRIMPHSPSAPTTGQAS